MKKVKHGVSRRWPGCAPSPATDSLQGLRRSSGFGFDSLLPSASGSGGCLAPAPGREPARAAGEHGAGSCLDSVISPSARGSAGEAPGPLWGNEQGPGAISLVQAPLWCGPGGGLEPPTTPRRCRDWGPRGHGGTPGAVAGPAGRWRLRHGGRRPRPALGAGGARCHGNSCGAKGGRCLCVAGIGARRCQSSAQTGGWLRRVVSLVAAAIARRRLCVSLGGRLVTQPLRGAGRLGSLLRSDWPSARPPGQAGRPAALSARRLAAHPAYPAGGGGGSNASRSLSIGPPLRPASPSRALIGSGAA